MRPLRIFLLVANFQLLLSLQALAQQGPTYVTNTFTGDCAFGPAKWDNVNSNPSAGVAEKQWCKEELGGSGWSCDPATSDGEGHCSKTCKCFNPSKRVATEDPLFLFDFAM